MPNTKGAKKRLRQSIVRRDRNRADKTRVRSSIRKFREAIAAKNFDEAQEIFKVTVKLLDQAAAKKVLHRNKVARIKSRMTHFLLTNKSAAA